MGTSASGTWRTEQFTVTIDWFQPISSDLMFVQPHKVTFLSSAAVFMLFDRQRRGSAQGRATVPIELVVSSDTILHILASSQHAQTLNQKQLRGKPEDDFRPHYLKLSQLGGKDLRGQQ